MTDPESQPDPAAVSSTAAPRIDADRDARVRAVTRPEGALMAYYVLKALAVLPLCWLVIWPLLFRYKTLRYGFEDDGISVSWGILFRREVHLTYARIQDIHVSRNVVERWLGIGTVSVQTASGSGDAEAQIEGVSEFDAIRDFLYAKSRGIRSGDTAAPGGSPDGAPDAPIDEASDADPVALLQEIRDTLRLLADHAEGGHGTTEDESAVESIHEPIGESTEESTDPSTEAPPEARTDAPRSEERSQAPATPAPPEPTDPSEPSEPPAPAEPST